MVHCGFASTALFTAAIVSVTLGGLAEISRADETDSVAALPANYLSPPRQKVLPARDCPQCCGPAPAAPCFDTHRGFLYYGSYPWDDDPANGFDDCPRGRCGYPGAALSLWWIGIHNPKAKRSGHRHHGGHHAPHGHPSCPSCNSVPHYPTGGSYPVADSIEGPH